MFNNYSHYSHMFKGRSPFRELVTGKSPLGRFSLGQSPLWIVPPLENCTLWIFPDAFPPNSFSNKIKIVSVNIRQANNI